MCVRCASERIKSEVRVRKTGDVKRFFRQELVCLLFWNAQALGVGSLYSVVGMGNIPSSTVGQPCQVKITTKITFGSRTNKRWNRFCVLPVRVIDWVSGSVDEPDTVTSFYLLPFHQYLLLTTRYMAMVCLLSGSDFILMMMRSFLKSLTPSGLCFWTRPQDDSPVEGILSIS